MIERIQFLWPEIALFATTCIVMVLGLSPRYTVRKSCAWVSGLGLVVAGILAAKTTPTAVPGAVGSSIHLGQFLLPGMVSYVKVLTAIVGLMLLMLLAGSVDRDEEARIASGGRFDALRSNRAEFYSFFLFSLTGLMLCASADDLIWLFLALELTSLPTYIMVVIAAGSRGKGRAQEAGVKYFFLGALGAAIFLYGFSLIYGGTGSTNLNTIHAVFMAQGINSIALAGLLLALLGMCFKIAAVPMHFYTPDVYQGAASPVAAFLAFVPKTAGFVSIMLLVGTAGWVWSPGSADVANGGGFSVAADAVNTGFSLPEPIRLLLWVIAALTMTVGNVLAIWQNSVKRLLAYSSIAHSGYMLVGIIAGPGDGTFTKSGLAAVMFYLLCYGVMNVGAFAVLGCLQRRTADGRFEEIETFEDLRGLCQTRPVLGWTMALCSLSLLGFPPLLGFLGKLPLFTSAISAGEITLVVVLGINSAIAAFYYLRLFSAVALEKPEIVASKGLEASPFVTRTWAALASAGGVVALLVVAGDLMDASASAGRYMPSLSKPAGTTAEVAPAADQPMTARARRTEPIALSRRIGER